MTQNNKIILFGDCLSCILFFCTSPSGAFRDEVTLKHEQKNNSFGPFDLPPLSLGRGIWNDLNQADRWKHTPKTKPHTNRNLNGLSATLNDLWQPDILILEFAHTYMLKSRHYKHASLRKNDKCCTWKQLEMWHDTKTNIISLTALFITSRFHRTRMCRGLHTNYHK